MKAIEYVVRDSAGAVDRGVIPANAETSKIVLESGREVSLNLRRGDLKEYQRDGDDLIVELADGRVIVLENYFNDVGEVNRLFLSAEGYLNEVAFVETADGALFGQYGPTQEWGKWSPSDDLIFLGGTDVAGAPGDEDVSMLAAGLIGSPFALGGVAAGVAGVALVGGDDSDGTKAPYVDGADDSFSIGGDGPDAHVIEVTGGGSPKDSVAVTVGDTTLTTVIGEDGTFGVTFEGDDFPADGNYDASVVVTDDKGEETPLDGPTYVIDTTPPTLEILTGTASVGDAFNSDEFSDGVSISGVGEPGATVEITIEGVTETTTVADDGSWTVTWDDGELPVGEYSTGVDITTRDDLGNSWSTSDTLIVDTVNDVTIDTASVEGDGTINADELADGVTITGTSQPDAAVEVSVGDASIIVTTDEDGAWTADFDADDIPGGSYDATVTAVSTDIYSNTDTATGTVTVDTEVAPFTNDSTPGGADGVINDSESDSGLVLTGEVEPGSSVEVQFGGETATADVTPGGAWSVTFPASVIPEGELTVPMVATATDAAGNVSTLTQDVVIDTVANDLSIAGPVEGDNVVNETEASDGVVLSGDSVPGAVVNITLGGVTQTAVADTDGSWQSFFAASDVAPGTYDATIVATSTDAAGNTNTVTENVRVDTAVDGFAMDMPIEGDNIVSGAEYANNVEVSGTVEPGSTVAVTIDGVTIDATVDAAGNWQAVFTSDQLPDGEYDADVTVLATDPAGNMASLVEGVRVDTFVNELSIAPDFSATRLEGDGTINAVEATDGVNFGGQVEAGSSVVVDFNGTPVQANVAANGKWTATIPASAIAAGTYDAEVVVTATDAVGNMDEIRQIVSVDTDAPDGPVVAAFTRDTDGLRAISTEGDNASTQISQVTEDGMISEAASVDTYIAPFDETLHAFTGEVPDGTDLVVSNVDGAGNVSSTYLAMDDETPNSAVDLSNPALGMHEIEAVDLQFAEAATLTLDEAQIKALSGNSDTLTVHGGSDDTVQVAGAVRTGATTQNGQNYDTYQVGDATLIVDSDISVEEPPVI